MNEKRHKKKVLKCHPGAICRRAACHTKSYPQHIIDWRGATIGKGSNPLSAWRDAAQE